MKRLPGPIRYPAENAFLGFDRAHLIFDVDREMASFRAITAEEEAATALFMALKGRKYPGSEMLNPRDHRHKAALAPFLTVVRTSLSQLPSEGMKMTLDWTEPSVTVHLPLAAMGVTVPNVPHAQLTITDPLDLRQDKGRSGQPYQFGAELEKLLVNTGFSSIQKFVDSEANARNTLLYASNSALPASRATYETLAFRQARADLALYLAIAVYQTPRHQTFAKQALQAFLGVVGKGAPPMFEYPPPPEVDVTFTLRSDHEAVVEFMPRNSHSPSAGRVTGSPGDGAS